MQNRYTFNTEVVSGKQIKEKANIPAGFSLYRRVHSGNEPIRDDDELELHRGDHFLLAATLERLMIEEDFTKAGAAETPATTRQGCAVRSRLPDAGSQLRPGRFALGLY